MSASHAATPGVPPGPTVLAASDGEKVAMRVVQ